MIKNDLERIAECFCARHVSFNAFASIGAEFLHLHVVAGVLVDFISIPVTVGFTSATSVIIVASQLKGLLGLTITSQGFLDTLIKVVRNITDASPWDTAMSVTCIAILLLFRVTR